MSEWRAGGGGCCRASLYPQLSATRLSCGSWTICCQTLDQHTNPYSCDKGRLVGLYLVAYSNFKGCSNVFTLLNEAEGTLSPSSLYLRCSLIVKITQNWLRMFNSVQLLVLGTVHALRGTAQRGYELHRHAHTLKDLRIQ